VPTTPPPTTASIRPSRYQSRIIDFVRNESGNGVILATAGAGKTSTLVQVAASLPNGLHSCFLAFGRDAAAELASRLPESATAMTVHRLGRITLRDALLRRGVTLRRVDRGKYRRLIRGLVGAPAGNPSAAAGAVDAAASGAEGAPAGASADAPNAPASGAADCRLAREGVEYLLRLSQLARLCLVDAGDESAVHQLALRFNLVPPADPDTASQAHALLPVVLREGLEEAWHLGLSDFTDMLWLPLELRLQPPRFDFVCVDEAQDYSALALAFTLRLVDPAAGGRLLFVGDPRQSVYGFAGAASDALERIVEAARAKVLPLSISYRCPRRHVELARLMAPEIEARPEAPAGGVFWISDTVLDRWAREGDLILCRANAPLVATCLRLARSGRRAFVLGRDLARQLGDLARRALPPGTEEPDARLDIFASAEESRLRLALADRPHAQAAVSERLDLIECLRFLAREALGPGAAGPDPLAARIERTFGAREDAVALSTIHRAKGKEADRVFILYPELMPAPYAHTAEALRGEASVQFVALTRARRDLVFVSEPAAFRDRSSGTATREREPASGRSRSEPASTWSPASRSRSAAPETFGASSGNDDEAGMEDAYIGGYDTWRSVLERARMLACQRR
jgi:DNA helicase-2/ATP-dependent DNA helicase PcrA